MLSENKRVIRTFLLLFVLTASFVLVFLFSKNSSKKNLHISCPDCNIILISIEPLRVDHLGSFGYDRGTSPNIDKLAEKGIQFTNAISTSSWTLPASMSIFTSTYPDSHRVLNKVTLSPDGEENLTNLKKLSPNIKTLAEELKNNDYETAAFTGGAALEAQFGFDQGFGVYKQDGFAGLSTTAPEALDWIKQNRDSKFFVYLQGYDTHGQYVPEDGYDKRFVDFDYTGSLTGSTEEQKQLREDALARGELFLSKDDVRFLTDLYDEKVQRMDEKVGIFMDEYNKLGLSDKTIFIFVSSHGEELYDHGRIDHGHSLYDELIHVPLIITGPNIPHREIATQVSTLDIMPTIFQMLNIQIPPNLSSQMAGTSLLSSANGENNDLAVYPETDYRHATYLRGVRTNSGYMYIYNAETGKEELYNTKKDPEEKQNIASSDTKTLDKLRALLSKHFGANND